jgi:Fe-S cluster biosynthesis and repair protein YggX
LTKAPFKGPQGEAILNRTCSTCWQEWIRMGTKVINELGLVLSTPSGQETYDQYMVEFLQLEDA